MKSAAHPVLLVGTVSRRCVRVMLASPSKHRPTGDVLTLGRILGGGALAVCIATTAACTGGEVASKDSQPALSASGEDAVSLTLGAAVGEVRETLDGYEGIATGAIVLVRVGERTRVLTSGMADVGRRVGCSPMTDSPA